MMMLDKRLHAFRSDMADAALRGQVDCKVFREGALAQLAVPLATLHRAPAADAAQDTQVFLGETLRVFDVSDGWAWVQLSTDKYVGYIRHEFLSAKIHATTHHVIVPATVLYSTPDIKTQPVKYLNMNSQLCVTAISDKFVELATGGFVFAAHVAAVSILNKDFVEVAERFVHTPYLWGGKSSQGIDCSGLVQTALLACGVAMPRDTDMLAQLAGINISRDDLQRGDLVFWKGHVGIMQSATQLLHASGHQMLVVTEPLQTAEERTLAKGKEITTMRRLII